MAGPIIQHLSRQTSFLGTMSHPVNGTVRVRRVKRLGIDRRSKKFILKTCVIVFSDRKDFLKKRWNHCRLVASILPKLWSERGGSLGGTRISPIHYGHLSKYCSSSSVYCLRDVASIAKTAASRHHRILIEKEAAENGKNLTKNLEHKKVTKATA